jgi:hypothetical protein
VEDDAAKRHTVEVTISITSADGETTTTTKEITSGNTKVSEIKVELEVPAEDTLWVINEKGKKHQLNDNGRHEVKAGDHYEAIPRGGVS